MANIRHLSTGYIFHSFVWFLVVCLRQLFAREMKTAEMNQSVVIHFISIDIDTPEEYFDYSGNLIYQPPPLHGV